ncbi:hypothetical protein OXX79_014182, partial [Metschnikowia pulcherrima]
DSIVSISQWVLFHHRHATHLCELWADYTLDNNASAQSKKKLSLLYLCNDVVQQARHKRKPEFTAGFAAKLPVFPCDIWLRGQRNQAEDRASNLGMEPAERVLEDAN